MNFRSSEKSSKASAFLCTFDRVPVDCCQAFPPEPTKDSRRPMRPKRKLARKQRITEIFAVFGTMALFSGLQNYLKVKLYSCFKKHTKSRILPSRGDRRLTLKHDHCQWDLAELESLSVGGSLQANQCISFEH